MRKNRDPFGEIRSRKGGESGRTGTLRTLKAQRALRLGKKVNRQPGSLNKQKKGKKSSMNRGGIHRRGGTRKKIWFESGKSRKGRIGEKKVALT